MDFEEGMEFPESPWDFGSLLAEEDSNFNYTMCGLMPPVEEVGNGLLEAGPTEPGHELVELGPANFVHNLLEVEPDKYGHALLEHEQAGEESRTESGSDSDPDPNRSPAADASNSNSAEEFPVPAVGNQEVADDAVVDTTFRLERSSSSRNVSENQGPTYSASKLRF